MQRQTTVFWLMLVAAYIVFGSVAPESVLARSNTAMTQSSHKPVDIRLRSFTPGASGRLSLVPTTSGGSARLTTLGLPSVQTLDERARSFVVWAIAAGGRAINLGELRTDARGNGDMEFASPASLARYSVMVTAEASANARNPQGTPVLSTRAGEVAALFAEREADKHVVRKEPAPNVEPHRRSTRRSIRLTNFYTEVDEALRTGASRRLRLVGGDVAPRARASARVTTLNGNAFVRIRISQLPPPAKIGANTYVLWGRTPDGRVSYLGSLPTSNTNNADIYVRANKVNFGDFELMVTAENRRPVARPSSRNALLTRRRSPRARRSSSARTQRVRPTRSLRPRAKK